MAGQRILRVSCGSSIPPPWRFVQWIGKETDPLDGHWSDIVLCEFEGADGRHDPACEKVVERAYDLLHYEWPSATDPRAQHPSATGALYWRRLEGALEAAGFDVPRPSKRRPA